MHKVIQEFQAKIQAGLDQVKVVVDIDHYLIFYGVKRYPGSWTDSILPVMRLMKSGCDDWRANASRFVSNQSDQWEHRYIENPSAIRFIHSNQWLRDVHQPLLFGIDGEGRGIRCAKAFKYLGLEHKSQIRANERRIEAAKAEHALAEQWRTKFTNTMLQELVCLPRVGSVYLAGVEDIYGI